MLISIEKIKEAVSKGQPLFIFKGGFVHNGGE